MLKPFQVKDTYARLAEHVVNAISRNVTDQDLLKEAVDELKREVLMELLTVNGNNKCLVARILGWHRNTMGRELKRLGIKSRHPRRSTVNAQQKAGAAA